MPRFIAGRRVLEQPARARVALWRRDAHTSLARVMALILLKGGREVTRRRQLYQRRRSGLSEPRRSWSRWYVWFPPSVTSEMSGTVSPDLLESFSRCDPIRATPAVQGAGVPVLICFTALRAR